jgi:DNA/RNA endonuclease G (NUC1)
LSAEEIAQELKKILPSGNVTAARKRLTDTEIKLESSTVSQISDEAALRLVTFDKHLLMYVSGQSLDYERSFVKNIDGLPQEAAEKYRSLSLPEQQRLSALNKGQIIKELDGVAVPEQKTPELNVALGNPSSATASIDNPNNYLIERSPYALSYNRDKAGANWVSWHTDSLDLGSVPRTDDFKPDAELPEGWYRVQPTDLKGTGYDRGHMIPAADRSASFEDQEATFTLSNILPQASNNNQKTWSALEGYSRDLVREGNEVYVIAGGYGSKGTLQDGKINIPDRTWKVIVVLPKGENDLARITENTRVIAVDMPNSNDINEDWTTYRTSVDAIEKATGYDFLSNVSTVIQNVIEARVDDTVVPKEVN